MTDKCQAPGLECENCRLKCQLPLIEAEKTQRERRENKLMSVAPPPDPTISIITPKGNVVISPITAEVEFQGDVLPNESAKVFWSAIEIEGKSLIDKNKGLQVEKEFYKRAFEEVCHQFNFGDESDFEVMRDSFLELTRKEMRRNETERASKNP